MTKECKEGVTKRNVDEVLGEMCLYECAVNSITHGVSKVHDVCFARFHTTV